MTPKEQIAQAMTAQGITVAAEFVPWKDTPEGKKGKPAFSTLRLNWRVTVLKDAKPILCTPYQTGVAHAPSYKRGHQSVADLERVTLECNTGRGPKGRILPEPEDVMHCLLSDASAIDSGSFEDWASDCGYDTDSRKAEAIYRTCLDIGLKLRAALGDAGLAALQEAARDY